MRIGISYNVFDAEELLEDSIKCIRDQVDYVSVIYQEISNFGNPASPNLLNLLEDLKSKHLVNEIQLFNPKPNLGGHINELTKRNFGLMLSTKANCTHHMSMDTDEFYLPAQFAMAKQYILENDCDSSFCGLETYYKTSEYAIRPHEEYFVPLIYKIRKGHYFVFGTPQSVLTDPTRRIAEGKSVVFQRDQILMHHLTGVREDYRKKLVNSSASPNFVREIDMLVDYFNKWEYPQQALMPGLPPRYFDVEKVNKLFNTIY